MEEYRADHRPVEL